MTKIITNKDTGVKHYIWGSQISTKHLLIRKYVWFCKEVKMV